MKIISAIKNIIMDIIIVILILTIIIAIINKNKPTPLFGYYFFTIMSGSMQPTLNIDDNIIVKHSNNYKVGDIVTFKEGNKYVTHRIVDLNDNKVTTRGDANTTDDPPFDKKNILGKLVFKSKYLNFLVKNRILLILFVILIYLIGLVFNDDKEVKGNVKEGS